MFRPNQGKSLAMKDCHDQDRSQSLDRLSRSGQASLKSDSRAVPQKGFSLIENLLVILFVSIMVAATVLSTSPLQTFRMDSAMDEVVRQLRTARSQAMAQRREIQIQFFAPNQMQSTRFELPSGTTPSPTVTVSSSVQFIVVPGVPDTPMAFGNNAPIYFENQSGGPALMKFATTGAFIDAVGNPVNGTVFLGIPGNNKAARAITVLGATGRIRQYTWNGSSWQE